MTYRLVCTGCRATARAALDTSRLPPGVDPLTAVLRAAARQGWAYRGGRVGRSVVDVVCPACRDPLYVEADFDPREAEPGTYDSDLREDPGVPTVVEEGQDK